MNGKVVLVTGAAGGIGQQMCTELAKRGATVVAAARDEARAAEAVRAIVAAAGAGVKVEPLACDVASVAAMKAATTELMRRHPAIHLLVNNAGVFNKERRTSKDGLELGYAVNVLAPYVMSTLLLPALKAGAPSRVVNMTMTPTDPLDLDDLQLERNYSGMRALRTTKAGHQYLTLELAHRLRGSGVTAVTVDPGITQSKLPSEAPLPIRLIFKLFGKTPAQGAQVPLKACLDPDISSGAFISNKGKAVPMPAFVDAASSARVWAANARLSGI
jgi:NAD(P)-dependent dehydrogenase (short-subunit alcohol dehydrogenase family)